MIFYVYQGMCNHITNAYECVSMLMIIFAVIVYSILYMGFTPLPITVANNGL